MKRILLGLFVLGLALSVSMLGCRLPASEEAAEQTQVSSTKTTFSEDGYFGEELSFTYYEDEDNYNQEQDIVDDRWTVTFKTDGTWVWIHEAWEGKAFIGGADDDDDGDGTNNEGWVMLDGEKGTYSYNTETYEFTLNATGVTWDDANENWNGGWGDNDPAISGGDVVSVTYAGTFNSNDIFTEANSTSLAEGNLDTIFALFNGSAYAPGGVYTIVNKAWNTAGTWPSDKEYNITYYKEVYVFDDTNDQLTFWVENYTEDTTATSNEYTNVGGTGKSIYIFTKSGADYAISSGYPITFSVINGLYTLPLKAVPDDFDEDKGTYAWLADTAANRAALGDINVDNDNDGNIDFTPSVLTWDTVVDLTGDGDYLFSY